jgi:hypothetical protein
MCKSHYFVLSTFFLCASIAFSDCPKPQAPIYNVDLTTVNVSIQTIVAYSLVGQERSGHTVNEVFFLGSYKSDSTNLLHLFCREVDASTGTELDVDLGCVQGVLLDKPLYVWPSDPKANNMHAMSHYPVRYVTNVPPGSKIDSSNTRVEVKGVGNDNNPDGVYVSAQN